MKEFLLNTFVPKGKFDFFYAFGKLMSGALVLAGICLVVVVISYLGYEMYKTTGNFLGTWASQAFVIGFAGLVFVKDDLDGYRAGGMYAFFILCVSLFSALVGWGLH